MPGRVCKSLPMNTHIRTHIQCRDQRIGRTQVHAFTDLLAEAASVFGTPRKRRGACDCPACTSLAQADRAIDAPMCQRMWAAHLPRILTAIATGTAPRGPAFTHALAAFPTGEQVRWSEAEWRILDDFRRLTIELALADEMPGRVGLFDALAMFLRAGWPLAMLLNQVLADPELPSALAREWGFVSPTGLLLPGSWPDNSGPAIRAALITPAMAGRVAALAEMPDLLPELREDALRTAELLSIACKSR